MRSGPEQNHSQPPTRQCTDSKLLCRHMLAIHRKAAWSVTITCLNRAMRDGPVEITQNKHDTPSLSVGNIQLEMRGREKLAMHTRQRECERRPVADTVETATLLADGRGAGVWSEHPGFYRR